MILLWKFYAKIDMHLFLAHASIFASIFISAAIRAVPVILFSIT